jgi:hypothetical protein
MLIRATIAAAALVAVAVWVWPDPELLAAGRRSIAGSNVIGAGRLIGAGTVAAAAYALTTVSWTRIASIVTALAGLTTLLATGVRGTVVGTAAAAAAVALGARASFAARLFSVTTIGVATAVAAWWLLPVDSGAVARIAPLAAGEVDDPARWRLLSLAWEVAVRHPLGLGWGGFASHAAIVGPRGDLRYPHNISLEIAVEGGWLAAALFLIVTVLALSRLRRASNTPDGTALLALAVFWLVQAHVSGDVNSTRMLWVIMAVGMVSISHPTSMPKRPSNPASTQRSESATGHRSTARIAVRSRIRPIRDRRHDRSFRV